MNTITIEITIIDFERVRVTATWPSGHMQSIDIPADGLDVFLQSFEATVAGDGDRISVPAPGANTHYARRARGAEPGRR